ncbi:MAG: hypothetical protein QM608_13250 [Caulobacter sp.]
MSVIANLDEFILEETDQGVFLTLTADDDQTMRVRVTLDDLEEIMEVIDEVFGVEVEAANDEDEE